MCMVEGLPLQSLQDQISEWFSLGRFKNHWRQERKGGAYKIVFVIYFCILFVDESISYLQSQMSWPWKCDLCVAIWSFGRLQYLISALNQIFEHPQSSTCFVKSLIKNIFYQINTITSFLHEIFEHPQSFICFFSHQFSYLKVGWTRTKYKSFTVYCKSKYLTKWWKIFVFQIFFTLALLWNWVFATKRGIYKRRNDRKKFLQNRFSEKRKWQKEIFTKRFRKEEMTERNFYKEI